MEDRAKRQEEEQREQKCRGIEENRNRTNVEKKDAERVF